MAVVVRPGRTEDADAIAAIHGRAWLHAYERFLPYDELTKHDEDDRRRRWTDVLADADGHAVLVATTGDDVPRGFATFGPARDAEYAGTVVPGELSTLYVDPPAQGAGVGRRLHDAALDGLRAAGFADAVVWVYEENAHALLFYGRIGWLPDAGPRIEEGWAAPGVRLRRPL
jgi:GNAT superfamily N-acetyltransferase